MIENAVVILPEDAQNEISAPGLSYRVAAVADPVLLERLMRAEVRAEVIYALHKIGILVTNLNRDRLDPSTVLAWDAAIAEYLKAKCAERVEEFEYA